jgi:Methyltransferase domain
VIDASSPEGAKLLKVLHVMNADGSVSADMRRKLNQVQHLVELFRPVLEEIARFRKRVRVLDLSCGNSYLGFLLRHHVVEEIRVPFELVGIDRSQERVSTCRSRASKLGWAGLEFVAGEIADAAVEGPFDLLVSLHGCDTASDDALKRGVELRIPHIHVAPCCQKEVRPLVRDDGRFASFLRDGIVAAEFAATLTDVIRAVWLRTRGYRAEIVEFVPLEHSLKNRLIRAKFTRRNDGSEAELAALLAELTSPPAIARS